jgi:hypothetical protein
MSDIPLHRTRMGQTFFERTLPELVKQLTRLNENLERIAACLEVRGKPQDAR